MVACSILKYFKPVGSSSSFTNQTLPDPDGPLNEKVPAIELANAEVEQLEASPRGGRRSPYLILTPEQRYVACPRGEYCTGCSFRYKVNPGLVFRYSCKFAKFMPPATCIRWPIFLLDLAILQVGYSPKISSPMQFLADSPKFYAANVSRYTV